MAIGCVICAEEFSSSSNADKLPCVIKGCGHAFHDECLKLWLKKSKTCPICRNTTLDSSAFIVRLHLQRLSLDNPTFNNILDENLELKKKLEDKEAQIKLKDDEIKTRNKQIGELQAALADITVQVKNIEECLKNLKKIQVDKAALNHESVAAVAATSTTRPPCIYRTGRIGSTVGSVSSTSSRTASITAPRGIYRPSTRGRAVSTTILNTTRRT